jgi:glycosyltransferase involved in cell wall biosynthesis
MRIAVDIKAFKNGATGIARYLRSILDELQKIDTVNEYLLFSCAPSDYILTNPRWKMFITSWRLPGILWQQMLLPVLLKKNRIDVLWAPEQVCPVCCPRSIRVITTIHDLASQHFPNTSEWSVRLIHLGLTNAVLRRSDCIITVSDFIRKDLIDYYHDAISTEKVIAISNGIPEDWTLPKDYSTTNRKDFLFFAGNREPRKNLDRLVEALELLHKKYCLTVPLHLAGPAGWKNRSLHALIDNSPIKNTVKHLGYISEEELQREYLTCKALIYPSLYEGFGIPVIEALSLDCLVLTSAGTVMQEIAGQAALYFDPKETDSIASAIKRIYDPSFDRNEFMRNRVSVVEQYSWKKSAESLLSVFLKESTETGTKPLLI